MPQQLPAVSLVAVPGRRSATLQLAREIERRGFAGIYAPSMFSNMSLCEALAHCHRAHRVRHLDCADLRAHGRRLRQSAAFMHEVSGGRFRFGIGVSHAPAHVRMGVTPGKPLGDIRSFVAKLRAHEGIGALPPSSSPPCASR
jgi:alkanesulfonate monooxygenase SsuD/methylene tetrahydromethanopterin reductase-like flavin-dependent oxidoreductase (luciferase family)